MFQNCTMKTFFFLHFNWKSVPTCKMTHTAVNSKLEITRRLDLVSVGIRIYVTRMSAKRDQKQQQGDLTLLREHSKANRDQLTSPAHSFAGSQLLQALHQ